MKPIGDYQPHITLSRTGASVELSKAEPYRGELQFGRGKGAGEDWKTTLVEDHAAEVGC